MKYIVEITDGTQTYYVAPALMFPTEDAAQKYVPFYPHWTKTIIPVEVIGIDLE